MISFPLLSRLSSRRVKLFTLTWRWCWNPPRPWPFSWSCQLQLWSNQRADCCHVVSCSSTRSWHWRWVGLRWDLHSWKLSVCVWELTAVRYTHTHTHLHTSSSCLLSPGLSFMLPTQIQWIQNFLTYVLCVLISAGWPEAAAGLLFSPGLSGQEPGDVAAESGDGSQVSEGGSGKTLTLLN